MPAISVIIPAFKATAYICDALDSVLAQTLTDYEVIVVNDGCPDTANLERALDPYASRIKYVKQENRGPSSARNTGIRIAAAPLIALLDSDDTWKPNYLAVQTGMLAKRPELDVLYCNADIFGGGCFDGRQYMDSCPSKGEVTFESLLRFECHIMCSVTAKRVAVERAGMFDENVASAEDFDLWARVLKTGGKIAYHRQALVNFRQRPGSLSSDAVWMFNHALVVLDKLERDYPLTPSEKGALDRARSWYIASRDLELGKRALDQGSIAEATRLISSANTYYRKPKLSAALAVMRISPALLRGLVRLSGRTLA